MGGLEKNKHKDKKLNAGCGGVGKSIVAGIKDRETNQVKAKVIENTKRKTHHKIIHDNVESGSTVFTDDFESYKNLKDYFHQYLKHNAGVGIFESSATTSG